MLQLPTFFYLKRHKAAVEKFSTLLNVLDRIYVDSVDTDELVEIAIVKMLEELTPTLSTFREDLKEANEPLDGSFEGVAYSLLFKDTIMVVTPIAGGPSEKLGIMPGDRIVRRRNDCRSRYNKQGHGTPPKTLRHNS